MNQSNGMFTNPFRGYLDTMRPHAYRIGQVAAVFGCQVVDLLREIAENTSEDRQRTYLWTATVAAGTTRLIEIPLSQKWELTSGTALPVAAGNMVIREGDATGRLRFAFATAASGTQFGANARAQFGPGMLAVTPSVDTEVSLQFVITQDNDPQPGHSGERAPAGIHTNAVDLALQQHYPDLFRDPRESIIPETGTVYGASD